MGSETDATPIEPKFADEMTDFVYRDAEYRQFICADIGCSVAEFRSCLEFRRETLHEEPPLIGIFVEPQRKAANIYTGFFVLRGGKLRPQLIFFGTGIGSGNQRADARGYKIVRGSERRAPAEWVDFEFRWDGSYYRQFREKVWSK